MNKVTVFFVGTLAMALAAGPAFAQSPSTPTSPSSPSMSAPSTESTPAAKPGKLSMPHRVTGEVVAADQSAKTLTVKDSKGKEYVFTADTDAAGRLADLKAGDHVKVSYKKSHGQMIATKIAEASTA